MVDFIIKSRIKGILLILLKKIGNTMKKMTTFKDQEYQIQPKMSFDIFGLCMNYFIYTCTSI